ncbi:MAG: sel1 repeat family protein [Candidatus Tectomicrobia bacterium]|nr:sel1 repeat family protein [Candidatus Tectomicrobia bacterium]
MKRSGLAVLVFLLVSGPVLIGFWGGGAALTQEGAATDVEELMELAEQGHASAQFNLGVMYYDGQGVPQDYVEAAKWFRKAADQGDAPAQYNLGWMYSNGWGVPLDFILAHMWMNLAASRETGERAKAYSTVRDLLAREMTREQIAEAQRLAAAWKPKPSP